MKCNREGVTIDERKISWRIEGKRSSITINFIARKHAKIEKNDIVEIITGAVKCLPSDIIIRNPNYDKRATQ